MWAAATRITLSLVASELASDVRVRRCLPTRRRRRQAPTLQGPWFLCDLCVLGVRRAVHHAKRAKIAKGLAPVLRCRKLARLSMCILLCGGTP